MDAIVKNYQEIFVYLLLDSETSAESSEIFSPPSLAWRDKRKEERSCRCRDNLFMLLETQLKSFPFSLLSGLFE